jgi:hypothetical protein
MTRMRLKPLFVITLVTLLDREMHDHPHEARHKTVCDQSWRSNRNVTSIS